MRRNRYLFGALGILLFLALPTWAQQRADDRKLAFVRDENRLQEVQQKTDDPKVKPLPSKFDLRTINGVTPVKSQKGGTCWAHGTMAAIESNLILSGGWKSAGLDGIPACSEYHLDWWNGFNKHKNLDLSPPTQDKTGLTVHQGGDYRVSAAYMSRGEGVVLVPHGPDKQLDIGGWHKNPPAQDDPSYKRFYVRDIEWFVVGDNLENIDTIKRRIMTEGAIGTSYAANKSFVGKDNFHYQPATSLAKQNHAVAIVGWDDNKIDGNKKAPKAGAWLIKNSWGTKAGDQGYYWISYYDKHCGRDPEMGAVSFRNIEPMGYHHVYYHDYHGWRDTLKNVSKAFNAFTATGHQRIQSVSFYTAADNVSYTVKMYRKFEKGQLSGELAVKTGTIRHTGFHTIDLDAAVEVKDKDNFYVALEVSQGGHAFDRTSVIPVLLGQQKVDPGKDKTEPAKKAAPLDKTEPAKKDAAPDKKEPAKKDAAPDKKEPAKKDAAPAKKENLPLVVSKANPGESYWWNGKEWVDFYDYRFEDASHNHTANFCMKALAVNANGKPSPRPAATAPAK